MAPRVVAASRCRGNVADPAMRRQEIRGSAVFLPRLFALTSKVAFGGTYARPAPELEKTYEHRSYHTRRTDRSPESAARAEWSWFVPMVLAGGAGAPLHLLLG